jgi:hypothetical protein
MFGFGWPLMRREGRKSGMTHDEWRLLGYSALTVFLMALLVVPILLHNINFPKLVAEAILGVIALAVFMLSKYMERRKKSK